MNRYIDIHNTSAASLGSGNDYGQGKLVNQLLQELLLLVCRESESEVCMYVDQL